MASPAPPSPPAADGGICGDGVGVATAVPYPLQLLEAGKRHPGKIAFHCDGVRYTYLEFFQLCSGVAAEVVGCGFGNPLGPVAGLPHAAISCRKGIAWLVCTAVCSLLGIPYTLIDWRLGEPQRRQIWEAWSPTLLLVDAAAGGLKEIPSGLLHPTLPVVDVGAAVSASRSAPSPASPPSPFEIFETPASNIRPTSPAFIDWTTGTSTGKVKGVVTRHLHLSLMLRWRCENYPFSENETIAVNQFPMWYWWMGPCVGCPTSLIPDHTLIDSELFISHAAETGVTRIDCTTPSLLRAWLQDPAIHTLRPTLRMVVVSGEALPLETAQMLHTALPDTTLLNLLSTTEAGDVACLELPRSVTEGLLAEGTAFAPVGLPMLGVSLELSADHAFAGEASGAAASAPAPLELHVSGTGVPRDACYLGDPAASDSFVTVGGGGGGGAPRRVWCTKDSAGMLSSPKGAGLFSGVCFQEAAVAAEAAEVPLEVFALKGRLNMTAKVRGFRIDLAAIQGELAKASPGVLGCAVKDCVALAHSDELLAFLKLPAGSPALSPGDAQRGAVAALRKHLVEATDLPRHSHPTAFFFVASLPVTPTGKVDTRALVALAEQARGGNQQPQPQPQDTTPTPTAVPIPEGATEQDLLTTVRSAWRALLGTAADDATEHTSMWDIGAHSLLVTRLAKMLGLRVADLIETESLTQQAALLWQKRGAKPRGAATATAASPAPDAGGDIAVIGIGVRWPCPSGTSIESVRRSLSGAADLSVEIPEATLLSNGVGREALAEGSGYVRRGILLDTEYIAKFDPEFWGISQGEAEMTDPAQRALVEVSYEALLDAGYPYRPVVDSRDAALLGGVPEFFSGSSSGGGAARIPPKNVGVFACGGSLPQYLTDVIGEDTSQTRVGDTARYWALEVGNDKDYCATRLSHIFDLHGPAYTAQSACSSGLLCVANASSSLRAGECDLALVAAAGIQTPQATGYPYQPGMVWSVDGRCRPFDSAGTGTAPGNAVVSFVLRRVADAEKSGDRIYAVIKGCGVSNDGRRKHSFSAPSKSGQVDALRKALNNARITPDRVRMVEGHGTGTAVGDPIELSALSDVYGASESQAPIHLTSVKGHIGHANTAAGAAGLLKAVLSVHYATLFPTANHSTPSGSLQAPFRVDTTAQPWDAPPEDRICAVSSFGVGGTNVHLICGGHGPRSGAPPPPPPPAAAAPAFPFLLPVSAKSAPALQRQVEEMQASAEASVGSLASPEGIPELLRSMQHTLCQRPAYPHRRVICCTAPASTSTATTTPFATTLSPATQAAGEALRPAVFCFPGQGGLTPGLGQELLSSTRGLGAEFADAVREMEAVLGYDPIPAEAVTNEAAQVKTFALEYALARWAMQSVGVTPLAVVGHSIGEIVGAAVAGILSLKEALQFVALRGRLTDSLNSSADTRAGPSAGRMVSFAASADEVRKEVFSRASLYADHLEVSCINSTDRCVVSGPSHAVDALLQDAGAMSACPGRPLATHAAFHSRAVEPCLAELREGLGKILTPDPEGGSDGGGPNTPSGISVVSTVTGEVLTRATGRTPEYWVRHMRECVDFVGGIRGATALAPPSAPSPVVLEVGPRMLGGCVETITEGSVPAISLLPRPSAAVAEGEALPALHALCQLWQLGAVRGSALLQGGVRAGEALPPRIATLPPPAYKRRECWLQRDPAAAAPRGGAAAPAAAAVESAGGVPQDYTVVHRDVDIAPLPAAPFPEGEGEEGGQAVASHAPSAVWGLISLAADGSDVGVAGAPNAPAHHHGFAVVPQWRKVPEGTAGAAAALGGGGLPAAGGVIPAGLVAAVLRHRRVVVSIAGGGVAGLGVAGGGEAGPADPADPAAAFACMLAFAEVVQSVVSILRAEPGGRVHLILVAPDLPFAAPSVGFARSAARECPQISFKRILVSQPDVPNSPPTFATAQQALRRVVDVISDAFCEPHGADSTAWRCGANPARSALEEFRIRRRDGVAVEAEADAEVNPEAPFVVSTPVIVRAGAADPTADATHDQHAYLRGGKVLVTGGSSGVGSLIVSWCLQKMADRPAGGEVVSVSRSGGGGGGGSAALPSASGGPTLRHARCDVTDTEALAELIMREAVAPGPPLAAIFHCAGVVSDATIMNLDLSPGGEGAHRLQPLVAAKVHAPHAILRAIHAACPQGQGVPHVFLTSSSSAVLGPAGQALYTAANAYTDALVARLNQQGDRPASAVGSLQWGGWEVGMTERFGIQPERGEGFISRQEAGAVFDRSFALRSGPHSTEAGSPTGCTMPNKILSWGGYAAALALPTPMCSEVLLPQGVRAQQHPLLGSLTGGASGARTFTWVTRWPASASPASEKAWAEKGLLWVLGHRIDSAAVIPATLWVELMAAAAKSAAALRAGGDASRQQVTLESVALRSVLEIRELRGRPSGQPPADIEITTTVDCSWERWRVSVRSRASAGASEKHHCEALVSPAPFSGSLPAHQAAAAEHLFTAQQGGTAAAEQAGRAAGLYSIMREQGFQYSGGFQCVSKVVQLPQSGGSAAPGGFAGCVRAVREPFLHGGMFLNGVAPTVADAATQVASLLSGNGVPQRFDSVTHFGVGGAAGGADPTPAAPMRRCCYIAVAQPCLANPEKSDITVFEPSNVSPSSACPCGAAARDTQSAGEGGPATATTATLLERYRPVLAFRGLETVEAHDPAGDTATAASPLLRTVEWADAELPAGPGGDGGGGDTAAAASVLLGSTEVVHCGDSSAGGDSPHRRHSLAIAAALEGALRAAVPSGGALDTPAGQHFIVVLQGGGAPDPDTAARIARSWTSASTCIAVGEGLAPMRFIRDSLQPLAPAALGASAFALSADPTAPPAAAARHALHLLRTAALHPAAALHTTPETLAPGILLTTPSGSLQVPARGELRLETTPDITTTTPPPAGLHLPDGWYTVSVSGSSGVFEGGVHPVEAAPPQGSQALPSGVRLAAGEVLIAPRFWALNFLDVLLATGVMRGSSLGRVGGEVCGEVLAVGSAVPDLSPGDRVAGLPTRSGLGNFAVLSRACCGKVPHGMDLRHASTISLAYGTAWYALHWLARIRPGDKVLIHAAAGGVGQACVALARRAGATPVCTVSTQEKRDYLTQHCGVQPDLIFNSRNPSEFSSGVLAATGGVDVVVNSLSDEAMKASIRLLKPLGRFIELGKADQRGHTPLDLELLSMGQTYASAHLDVLMQHPGMSGRLLQELWEAAPELPPLPSRVFPLGGAPDAMAFLNTGKHIGKILLEVTGDAEEAGGAPQPRPAAAPLRFSAVPSRGTHHDAEVLASALLEGSRGGDVPPVLLGASTSASAEALLPRGAADAVRAAQRPLVVDLRPTPAEGVGGDGAAEGGIAAEDVAAFLAGYVARRLRMEAGEVPLGSTLGELGIDSLGQLQLTHALRGQFGSVDVDVSEATTLESIVASVAGPPADPASAAGQQGGSSNVQVLVSAVGGAPAGEAEPAHGPVRIMCLHGFRSSKALIQMQLRSVVAAIPNVELVVVNAPHAATGRGDARLPKEELLFEWWHSPSRAGPGGTLSYEEGWAGDDCVGLSESVQYLREVAAEHGPFHGVLGHSQGGAMAEIAVSEGLAKWAVLLSTVRCRQHFASEALPTQARTFHSFDPNEPLGDACAAIRESYASAQCYLHSNGHDVHMSEPVITALSAFIASQPGPQA